MKSLTTKFGIETDKTLDTLTLEALVNAITKIDLNIWQVDFALGVTTCLDETDALIEYRKILVIARNNIVNCIPTDSLI